MEQLRILHVFNGINRGGMESRTMDIYRHIDKTKYQFDFYVESGKHGEFEEEILSLGGKVFLLNKNKKTNIPDFSQFAKFINSHKYYIVSANNQWAGWYLKIAQKAGVPYRFANARTALQKSSMKNLIKNFVKLNVNKYSTHRFAVSKLAGDWLFGNNDYTVLPNAIDATKFRFSAEKRKEIRETLGIKEGEFVIVHVGNLRPEKNHPFLFEVFSEICKRKNESKLVLVGGKGEFDNYKDTLNKLGIIEKVIYLGVRNDVHDILQAGDCFVFPSFYEGFPGAVLEAEASGLWCLISDTITEEVDLTDSLHRMSLQLGPEKWADRVLTEYQVGNRNEAYKTIINAGYDINTLTKVEEELFDSLLSTKDNHFCI